LIEVFEAIRLDPEADLAEVKEAQANLEAAKTALREQLVAQTEATDARLFASFEADYRRQGFAEDAIADLMARHKADQEATQAYSEGRDTFLDHPEVVRYYSERREQERAQELARQMVAERPGHWERAVAEAQAGLDEFVNKLAESA
jgi:hypothetical protein